MNADLDRMHRDLREADRHEVHQKHKAFRHVLSPYDTREAKDGLPYNLLSSIQSPLCFRLEMKS